MSNVYSLDTLKNDLDKEFAPLKLEIDGDELVLRNLMRVNDKDRDEVLAALKVVEENAKDEDDEDEQSPEEIAAMSAAITTVIRCVTAGGKGEKLVQAIDGDLMLGMRVMELWTEATQPGEAQNSPA
jgi:hypothetical protein